MRRPTAAHIDDARRLLALESGKGASGEDFADTAGRIHKKLLGRLTTLVGAAGARALFARSAKLAATEFPCLMAADFHAEQLDSRPLVDRLRGQAPSTASEATVALNANLLALLETLIGARLTASVLRSAWPDFDATHQETSR